MDTIDAIVDDVLQKVDDETLNYLRAEPSCDTSYVDRLEYVTTRSEFQRWIRNTYGIWHASHPLTARWHAEGPNDLRDGIDYSSDHPDNLSGEIFKRVIQRASTT